MLNIALEVIAIILTRKVAKKIVKEGHNHNCKRNNLMTMGAGNLPDPPFIASAYYS